MQLSVQRRAVRRAVRTQCQAVERGEFRLFGERVLDLSPRGMLVSCDQPTRVGDDVVVSFKAPGAGELWLEAEAIVARLVHGQRIGDRGVCAGLDFTYFEKPARHELLARLAGLPPPIPQRRLRTARERRETQHARGLAGKPDALRAAIAKPGLVSVVVQEIVSLWDEPIFPLVRTRRAPRGVFHDHFSAALHAPPVWRF
ncbi:MAG TPA: PilZ domain-containing protein [Polyangiales bacterium]|nr:PilZ domain-containing protein [Polyangiales bacterium]